MKTSLTASFIKGIKPSKATQTFTCNQTKNLQLRVYPTGKKMWRWFGKVEGKPTSFTLGTFLDKGGMDLTEARKLAAGINEAKITGEPNPYLDAGKDAEAEAEVAIDPRAHMTCDWLFEQYMDAEGSKKKSAREKKRIYDHDIKPAIGDRHIDTINHDDLVKIMRDKLDAGSPYMSNAIQSLLRRWFRWATAVARDVTGLKDDPAQYLVKLTPPASRDRALDDYEIGVFFQALIKSKVTIADPLTVILYTGMRRSEAFGLQWTEIDQGRKAISIPKERIKNNQPLVLGVPDTVWELLEKQRQRTGNYAYVWPATRSLSEGVDDDEEETEDDTKANLAFSKPMKALNEACREIAAKDKKEIKPFTIHDLRRTLSTGMHGMMDAEDKPLIDSDIVERVINHTIAGVRGVYNKWGYFAEKKAALRLWAEHLDRIRKTALEASAQPQSEESGSAERSPAPA